jgi:hypothetical protein
MGEEAEGAHAEAVSGDFADADAFERFNEQAHPCEHYADLFIKPFCNCNFNKRACGAALENFDGGSGRFALCQPDAPFEAVNLFGFDSAFDLGDIGFCKAVSRVGKEVGKGGIVGEDNQACGVDFQPADAENSVAGRDEVDCLSSALRVKIGANNAFGFIEEEINPGLGFDMFT